jgi:hypothetical protein
MYWPDEFSTVQAIDSWSVDHTAAKGRSHSSHLLNIHAVQLGISWAVVWLVIATTMVAAFC